MTADRVELLREFVAELDVEIGRLERERSTFQHAINSLDGPVAVAASPAPPQPASTPPQPQAINVHGQAKGVTAAVDGGGCRV